MNFLVLGASGFLGSHVRGLLEANPDRGRGTFVSRHGPEPDTIGDAGSWWTIDLARADVADHIEMLKATRPDAVINCVGAIGGTDEQLEAANVAVVAKLVAALWSYGPIRLVHLGSAAEYGSQEAGVPVRETMTARPLSQYGRSKLAATELICDAIADGRIWGTVLRVFNPVGRGAPATSMPGRAALAMRDAQVTRDPSIILGPLDTFRDFVDARDVADAAVLAARAPEAGPILNVARGHAMSSRALVEILASIAGFSGEIIEDNPPSGRSDGVPWQQADLSLVTSQLGWAPRAGIEDALAELWRSTVRRPVQRNGHRA